MFHLFCSSVCDCVNATLTHKDLSVKHRPGSFFSPSVPSPRRPVHASLKYEKKPCLHNQCIVLPCLIHGGGLHWKTPHDDCCFTHDDLRSHLLDLNITNETFFPFTCTVLLQCLCMFIYVQTFKGTAINICLLRHNQMTFRYLYRVLMLIHKPCSEQLRGGTIFSLQNNSSVQHRRSCASTHGLEAILGTEQDVNNISQLSSDVVFASLVRLCLFPLDILCLGWYCMITVPPWHCQNILLIINVLLYSIFFFFFLAL